MKKYLSLLLLYVLFLVPAQAQTYQVTEEQLQKLEAICQNYKANNQKQQEQLDALMQKSLALQKDSQTLNEQLKNERTLTKNLNESLTKYEIKDAEKENRILELTQTIAEKDQKIGKLKITCVSLTSAVIILLLAIVLGIVIKMKLHK